MQLLINAKRIQLSDLVINAASCQPHTLYIHQLAKVWLLAIPAPHDYEYNWYLLIMS